MDNPDIQPANTARYTLDGDASVEARIDRDQQVIAEAVDAVVDDASFCGLILMGGYGRGEGGFVFQNGQPAPYNDYDYFVVVEGLDRPQRGELDQRLAQQAERLEHDVGVEVDFALLQKERLPGAEYSLMNAEMIWGHRVISGEQDALQSMPDMPFASLPMGEFTRLLTNRGALLLMNQAGLAAVNSRQPDQEVLFKYLFKAVLACGDARLAGNASYNPSYPRKLELLHSMEWAGHDEFMDLYELAWQHKFHPDYQVFAREESVEWQRKVVAVWLDTLAWFETQRSGRPFVGWERYASFAFGKGQGGSAWGGLRNLAITLRDFGPMELLKRPFWSLRYPRERLIAVLPLLLSDSNPGRKLSQLEAAALASGNDITWSQAVDVFLGLWKRYA